MSRPPRFEFLLMKLDGTYPRQTCDHLIDIDGRHITTQIFKDHHAQIDCRAETGQNREADDVLVRIQTSGWSCMIEAYTQMIIEQPLPNGQLSGLADVMNGEGLAIAASDRYIRTLAYVRPGDVMHFPDAALKVRFDIATEKTTSPPLPGQASKAEEVSPALPNSLAGAEVQVRSSDSAVEQQDSDSEDDDDLDRLPAPAKSSVDEAMRATPPVIEPMIKETPKHLPSALPEDEEPYSTAQDGLLEREEDVSADRQPINAESPSPLAQRSIALAASVDDEEVLKPRTVNTTYGKRQKSRTPQKLSSLPTPDDVQDLPERDESSHAENDNNNYDDIPATSDNMTMHDVTTEAAWRSHPVSAATKKRKVHNSDNEPEERESPQVNKKRRVDEERSPTPSAPKQEDVDDAEDESATDPAPSPPKTRGKLKKVTRKAARYSSEEIAVAPKRRQPSPVLPVVVKRHRKSTTPASSASSTLLGKTPKILLSTESAIHRNTALKAWLRKAGITIIDKVPSKTTNFVCVVTKDHSLKSAKVLHSLAMNKSVVTEDWLTDSEAQGELQDPLDYLHKTVEPNATHDKSRIFAGKHLFFTRAAVANYGAGWKDIQDVAKEAGASEVGKLDFDRSSHLHERDDVVFFGTVKGDEDVAELIKEYGRDVYSKDLFTDSIIAGELKLEQKLSAPAAAKRKRRS
ncbi:hypothetical protein BDY17DRAFT_294659 [Neohortaea acidophila]|uniref:BRCT domain-containing protein n=1 Tax=Neohortaea acidophila TaxID=245834 RepID=A0A6A6PWS3_9PEZI|nr:uncharacterized protein BDY17DRAFT_294659 [Neohortaea acidophila]KAF2483933.1 hypothetical protein BDY17DRAFT_294659 [Neohortaea acidophila]